MEDKINDGGDAFPCTGNPEHDQFMRGMSLRDWFAGMVVAELTRELHSNMVFDAQSAADRAYAVADAMLKARSQ
jgi:hypothetical protein